MGNVNCNSCEINNERFLTIELRNDGRDVFKNELQKEFEMKDTFTN